MLAFGALPAPSIAPADTGGKIDVSGQPAGNIRKAAEALAKSKDPAFSNTARQLAAGNIKAYYMEDLKHSPNEAKVLKDAGLSSSVYSVLVHPTTGEEMIVQKNAVGFASDNTIFGKRSRSVDQWENTLVHETNHVLNPVDTSNSTAWYKGEFRAYWVANYREGTDAERGKQIREHILSTYPAIKHAYDTDPAAKRAMDAYVKPDGDVTNKGKLK